MSLKTLVVYLYINDLANKLRINIASCPNIYVYNNTISLALINERKYNEFIKIEMYRENDYQWTLLILLMMLSTVAIDLWPILFMIPLHRKNKRGVLNLHEPQNHQKRVHNVSMQENGSKWSFWLHQFHYC